MPINNDPPMWMETDGLYRYVSNPATDAYEAPWRLATNAQTTAAESWSVWTEQWIITRQEIEDGPRRWWTINEPIPPSPLREIPTRLEFADTEPEDL